MTSPYSPATGRRTTSPAGPASWPRTALRMFLLILPTMVVASLVTARMVPYQTLLDRPWTGQLPNVVQGLLLGLVLGLVLRPTVSRLAGHLALAAGVHLVLVLVLFTAVSLRVPQIGSTMDRSSVATGIVLALLLQTVVAGLLWWRREPRTP